VGQPVNANIYRALFDVRREAPAEEVRFKYTYFTEMGSGSEEGSYLRLVELLIAQL